MQSVTSSEFTVDSSYDGTSAHQNLLVGTDKLSVETEGKITLVVRVVPASVGPFNNTAIASGTPDKGSAVSDESQNGTDPDPDNDGNPSNNNDPTPVDFGATLFDPPTGVKTVDASGVPALTWTVVWVNNSNIVAVDAVAHDPISPKTTFTPTLDDSGYPVPVGAPVDSTSLGVKCDAGTSTETITTLCYYEGPTTENPRGQIIWSGTLAPDLGVTDPALAVNAIHISFEVTTDDGVRRVTNTATIDSDLNGNGNTTDTGEQNVAQSAAVWGNSPQPPSTSSTETASELPIPLTGFAPGRTTQLSVQAADKQYTDLGTLWLEIPSLKVKASVVGVPQTTAGWDVSWLGQDAGWLNGTAYPTFNGNSVITGHVYDANGLPGPFIDLSKLKYGDQVIVHAWGQEYTFEVRETAKIMSNETAKMTVHKTTPWLTLVTCQGYDEKTDSYQYRYIVRAVLVSFK